MIRASVLDQSPVAAGDTPGKALRNTVELARLADRLGYERYWVAEHHGATSHAGTAPEIMATRLAAETSGIRVGAGGVLLPYYSPFKVAETFRVLEALYPGRIDLGIGRAAGSYDLEARALRRADGREDVDDFERKLTDLVGFVNGTLPADHPYREARVMPDVPQAPPVWLLGSSPGSALLAGRLGLPYSFAHFINPQSTRRAIADYHGAFTAVQRTGKPKVVLGLGVYCADTQAEADRIYASHLLIRLRHIQNVVGPVPSPEEALEVFRATPNPLAAEDFEWPRYLVGTPELVRDSITRMTTALGVDEVIVMNMIHDHGARLRCYELIAESLDLVPRFAEDAEDKVAALPRSR
ncbi:LLM class flavin-dependent oxidoreductase [Actinosynnema sp. NPDC023658]|uniref:LLM class flavin-dependent oxidoreductase n=1 Tax=Actinosynnema sp. NPDC023658 TaxID=3155465 RepID=UPI0033F4EC6A